MLLAITRLLKSNVIRTIASVVAVGAASIGFVSDILGLRGDDDESATVVTVLVNESTTPTNFTVDPTTTSVIGSTDPQVSLEQLRASLVARASSGILDGCGQQDRKSVV